ncbi:hypothetical protein [Pseudomonas sp. 8BK]|uniref:hypothetical protein n=1 Tax=Pseudomonas sp. 8BK TaxID=2653164 RepID=UPI00135BB638|nr:hypothetical protein [Pseudomonas sp. 8BK]
MHYSALIRSALYSISEILVFFIPLAVVSIVISSTEGTLQQILYSSDWWFITVLVLLDAIRDTSDVPRESVLKGLDHRMYLTVMGAAALVAMAFLALTAINSRKPTLLTLPDWYPIFQWLFLAFSLTASWLLKTGITYTKLKLKNETQEKA